MNLCLLNLSYELRAIGRVSIKKRKALSVEKIRDDSSPRSVATCEDIAARLQPLALPTTLRQLGRIFIHYRRVI
jgi:hypothetical protein